jgi:Glycosyl transferases group 1
VKWTPHAAAPYFLFNEINATASPTAILSGALSDWYPLRQMADKLVDPRIVKLRHPGYGNASAMGSNVAIKDRYANLLRAHAKMIEIPATGALLIVDVTMLPHLAELGLRSGEHFIPYHDAHSLQRALDYALSKVPKEADTVDDIRRRAQQVVLSRHSTITRARELADELRLWSDAWHTRHRPTHIKPTSACWEAFIADATRPVVEPDLFRNITGGPSIYSEQFQHWAPPNERFRQVALLSQRPQVLPPVDDLFGQ